MGGQRSDEVGQGIVGGGEEEDISRRQVVEVGERGCPLPYPSGQGFGRCRGTAANGFDLVAGLCECSSQVGGEVAGADEDDFLCGHGRVSLALRKIKYLFWHQQKVRPLK